MTGRIARVFAASIAPLSVSVPDQAPVEMPDMPMPEIALYAPGGSAAQSLLGTMRLGANVVSFEHLRGQAELEVAGVVPEFPGYRIATSFLSGATVYRVMNAEQYFQDNSTICGGKPLTYIVTKSNGVSTSQPDDWPTGAMNVWLLSLDDYQNFGPSTSDTCGGETYYRVKLRDVKLRE